MARIALYNPLHLPSERIEDIVEEAALPDGDVVLILGDPELERDPQGVCIPWAFRRFAANMYSLRAHVRDRWDCGVSLSEVWTRRHGEFPAYFAYLLGHELGHATTVLADLTLACFQSLVSTDIKAASGDSELTQGDLPFEVRYDQFGLAIAQAVCGRERVESDVERILGEGLSEDVRRLESLIRMEPRHDLGDLREDLAAFCLPFKDRLIARWRERAGSEHPGLTGLVGDLEWLWKANRCEGASVEYNLATPKWQA